MNLTPPAALQLAALAVLNIALAGMAGALACLLALRGQPASFAATRHHAATRVLAAAAGTALLAALAALWAAAAAMAELPLAQALPAMGLVLRDSHYGQAWLAGTAALAVLLVIAQAALRRGAPGTPVAAMPRTAMSHTTVPLTALPAVTPAGWHWLPLAICMLAIAVHATSRSLVSHAADSGELLPVLADALHLLLASLWAGSVMLAAGVVLVPPLRDAPADRLACARQLQLLSASATWALAGVALTGAWAAWRGLGGSAEAVQDTVYGRVLLIKLGLVALAVLLGGYNRWRVMPGLVQALRARQALPANGLPALRRFRAVLRLESLVLLAVLLCAAVLASSPPAVH